MMDAMRTVLVSVAVLAVFVAAPAAQSPDATVRGLVEGPKFRQATEFIKSDYDRFVRELITLTEIPAPPFKEEARARAFLEMLRQHGLSDVEMDAEGNVMGVRRGTSAAPGGPVLMVNAHLDTVFPEGTDVKVKREGTRLSAPGIGDDTRGLALILALIRTLDAAKFATPMDILFVGNVGEEGEGDLRGVKFLLKQGKYKDRVKQVLAIDGNESSSVTRGGVGSKRYRVTFKGPGGHSYGAFGLVNPAFAMGSAMARFGRLEVPASPKTTYGVGVVRGGTSVNSIPAEVSMDVDLRSESCAELKKIDDAFLAIVRDAVAEENRTRSTKEGGIEADPKVIGERPCGETPQDAPIVQSAAAAIRAFGLTPVFTFSSTDANVPMSLGIPAITIGRGGPGGRGHSPDEWVDVEPGANARNVQVALAILLSVAGGR
jgi:acetylornithine deacetylase/succinyl-diaminopimelate desuccinylase-like protein